MFPGRQIEANSEICKNSVWNCDCLPPDARLFVPSLDIIRKKTKSYLEKIIIHIVPTCLSCCSRSICCWRFCSLISSWLNIICAFFSLLSLLITNTSQVNNSYTVCNNCLHLRVHNELTLVNFSFPIPIIFILSMLFNAIVCVIPTESNISLALPLGYSADPRYRYWNQVV